MKKLFLFLAVIIVMSSSSCEAQKRDTTLPCNNDSITLVCQKQAQMLVKVLHERDSISSALYNANYTLLRVRKYLNICLKNPKQDKFLKGWIRRALEGN